MLVQRRERDSGVRLISPYGETSIINVHSKMHLLGQTECHDDQERHCFCHHLLNSVVVEM